MYNKQKMLKPIQYKGFSIFTAKLKIQYNNIIYNGN